MRAICTTIGELERWSDEALEIEKVQLERQTFKEALSGSKSELGDMQAAYAKLR